jgi:signal transduction histidine kinase
MKMKNPIYIIGGCILGLLLGSIFWVEGNYIAKYVVDKDSKWLSDLVKVVSVCIAVIVFIVVIKYFISIKNQRLIVYYLLSILIAVASVITLIFLVLLASAQLIQADKAAIFFETKLGIFLEYNILYIIYTIIVVFFSIVFSSLTKQKVKYIQYISKEIKIIEKEGVGRKAKVIGNDEIAELCISINHMSEQLLEKEIREKQIEIKKNELITNVSHDLRSPLTSIIGYVKLLKSEGIRNTEKFNEYIDVVDRRLHGLNIMIDELFELTKLNGTDVKLNLEEVDIISLLNHLSSENAILFQQKGLELKTTISNVKYFMMLDTEKVVRALQNLFDNASKYAKENTVVTMSVFVDCNRIKISMTNAVKEKSKIQIENLFERFYKGDVSRNDEESSGLGLAIVKRIVELHGGDIVVDIDNDQITFAIVFENLDRINSQN